MPIHVVWLGPEDTVTREVDLPAMRQPETPESWSDRALATLLPPALHFSNRPQTEKRLEPSLSGLGSSFGLHRFPFGQTLQLFNPGARRLDTVDLPPWSYRPARSAMHRRMAGARNLSQLQKTSHRRPWSPASTAARAFSPPEKKRIRNLRAPAEGLKPEWGGPGKCDTSTSRLRARQPHQPFLYARSISFFSFNIRTAGCINC